MTNKLTFDQLITQFKFKLKSTKFYLILIKYQQ